MRLIDGDALMKRLGIAYDCRECDQDKSPYCTWKPDAVDVCQIISDAPTIEPERKWIPCSERLPEMTHFMQDVNPFSDDVLVTIRNEYGSKCLLIGFFDSQHGWLFRDPRPIDGFTWKPIAWQPLSESYKEEGDQDDSE